MPGNPNAVIEPGSSPAQATRWAGGQFTGGPDIWQSIQSIPQNIWSVYQYTPNGLLLKAIKEMQPGQVEGYLNSNPELKNKVTSILKDGWSTIWNPIVSTSKLITWLPYMLVAGLVLFGFYAFKNPGSVSLPKKFSLT